MAAARLRAFRLERNTGQVSYAVDLPPAGAEGAAEAAFCSITPVTLLLDEDVRVAVSGSGEPLLYRGALVYGKRLGDALESGWCRVAEDPAAPLAAENAPPAAPVSAAAGLRPAETSEYNQ